MHFLHISVSSVNGNDVRGEASTRRESRIFPAYNLYVPARVQLSLTADLKASEYSSQQEFCQIASPAKNSFLSTGEPRKFSRSLY